MVARHAVRPGAAVAALALALAARADEGSAIFYAVLPVESAPGVAADGLLRVTLELNPAGVEKVPSVREWFPGARAAEARVGFVLDGRAPAARGRPSKASRRASFLVDFDRPEVSALRAEVARRFGPALSDEDLARFVDAWIERKSMRELMDVASTVAVRREGDCSEHAVLLAAVARLHGRAARIVAGLALVPVDGSLRVFGHAWTEIHDGRAWRTLDASPLPPGVRYLPLGVFVEEGPAYAYGALQRLSPLDVRRVVIGLTAAPRAPRSAAAPPRTRASSPR